VNNGLDFCRLDETAPVPAGRSAAELVTIEIFQVRGERKSGLLGATGRTRRALSGARCRRP